LALRLYPVLSAAHGHSKEKRTDCPLVTLGLVLDSSGFPIRSKVFSEKEAVVVKKDKDCTVKAYKKINDQTVEVELYCLSTRRILFAVLLTMPIY